MGVSPRLTVPHRSETAPKEWRQHNGDHLHGRPDPLWQVAWPNLFENHFAPSGSPVEIWMQFPVPVCFFEVHTLMESHLGACSPQISHPAHQAPSTPMG